MQIDVIRSIKTAQSTQGSMSVNGIFACYTLEPTTREVAGQPVSQWKIQDQTAIPLGTYTVTIDFSPKFDRSMPLVNNVPDFDGVRIHWGNYPHDTDGCCLVGETMANDFVGNSREAFNALFPKIAAAIADGETVTITFTEA